ncbi:hypothetical protein P5V15_006263 [Pogonomyrmex californicus]
MLTDKWVVPRLLVLRPPARRFSSETSRDCSPDPFLSYLLHKKRGSQRGTLKERRHVGTPKVTQNILSPAAAVTVAHFQNEALKLQAHQVQSRGSLISDISRCKWIAYSGWILLRRIVTSRRSTALALSVHRGARKLVSLGVH